MGDEMIYKMVPCVRAGLCMAWRGVDAGRLKNSNRSQCFHPFIIIGMALLRVEPKLSLSVLIIRSCFEYLLGYLFQFSTAWRFPVGVWRSPSYGFGCYVKII